MRQSLTVIALVLGILFFVMFYEAIVRALTLLGYVAAVVGAGSGIIWLLFARERLLILQAGRIEAQKQAHTLVVSDNGETWVRDTDTNATWRNLTGTPSLYVKGQRSEPTELEINLYQQRLAAMSKAPKTILGQAELLPSPEEQPIDLLSALDSVQRCLIVGVSDVGKTTLLKWLIHRRMQTSQVIVIDPHSYPDKWLGCQYVIGRGRNYAEIGRALAGLLKLMTKRYDEIGKGIVAEGGHDRVAILIDEWRAIVRNLGDPASEAIRALLTESRKAAFSIFVATHSDRAKPLGLEGEYDLKDGFAIVRLSLTDGKRTATFDLGNGEMPAVLPGPFPETGPVAGDNGLELDLELADQEPTEQEQQILDLYDQGKAISNIAIAVFGSKGGNQNKRVKDVLTKFDRV